MTRHSARSGRLQSVAVMSSSDGIRASARAPTIASIERSRSRSPPRCAGTGRGFATPRLRGIPRRVWSRMSLGARRRTAARSLSSVACDISTSSVRVSSGSPRSLSSSASRSSSPTSGESSAKAGFLARSARPVVRGAGRRWRDPGRTGGGVPAPGGGLRVPRRPLGARPRVPVRIGVGVLGRLGAEHGDVQLGDDLLGCPVAAVLQPDAPRQRRLRRREPDVPVVGRGAPEAAQLDREPGDVDRAAHRRPEADVGVVAGAADQVDDPGPPCRVEVAGAQPDDPLLGLRGLVVHGDPAGAVVQRTRDTGRPDGVEGVHRRHEGEPGRRGDPAQTGHRDLELRHRGEQDVEGLLRDPVQLLDVQQPAGAQRLEQRAVLEDLRHVALGQDQGRVEVADQPGGRQLGVALDHDERDPPTGGDPAQQRRLPGARRSLQQHVGAAEQGRLQQLGLGRPVDDLRGDVRGHDPHGGRPVHEVGPLSGCARRRRARSCRRAGRRTPRSPGRGCRCA